MNLNFKATWQKEWTLLDNTLIYAGKQISLSEIYSVRSIAKPTIITNGVIEIIAKGKPILLSYSHKSKDDGKAALSYLQSNHGHKYGKSANNNINQIQAEIDALPCKDDWGTRKEISELPNILNANEHIKAITSGLTEGNTWLIVCTNRRVLMIDKGLVYGLKLIDIPLDRINSISHYKGLALGKISITDGAVTRIVEGVSNATISFFVDTVNKEIDSYKKLKNNSSMRVNNPSTADEILKYKQLLDIGALTQDEFDAKKKELLGLK